MTSGQARVARVDPIRRFLRWYRDAERAREAQHDAFALATATREGRPSVRLVLLKRVDARGLVFYTNAHSRKGRELAANPRVAAAFYWHRTGRQVRIEGRVREVSRREADAYWATRPQESNVGALLSRQSEPLADGREFLRAWGNLRRYFRGDTVPRPLHWTGFRIVPEAIEFWTRGRHRLHRRELFQRSGRRWRMTLLQP